MRHRQTEVEEDAPGTGSLVAAVCWPSRTNANQTVSGSVAEAINKTEAARAIETNRGA